MNAHNFVAEHGVKKAKAVLDLAPKNSNYKYYSIDIGNNNSGWHVHYRANCIKLKELKPVVDSVELIRKLGGLIAARSALAVLEFETGTYPERLKQAIKDVELIEQALAGEKHE